MIESLAFPQTIKGVLSFDFDGTLLDPSSDPQLDPEFFELIKILCEEGWVWGVNTGRSQMQTTTGFMDGDFPFLPHFLVARERELYTPGQFGRWLPVREWNTKSEKAHKKMFRKTKSALKEIRKFVENETNARWVSEEGDPAGVVATTEAELARIASLADDYCEKSKSLSYLRNTIYMRFSHRDYHKGSSLAEIVRRCGVEKENVFAMGDGHNDLEMLDREIADMIACPANADDDVKAHVNKLDGYVCEECASKGVIEALTHFFE